MPRGEVAGELQRILFVEDDADIRMVALIALERVGGLTVAACESGQEALGRLDAVAPQMLLVDMMMEGMNGLETIAAIHARPAYARLPAVVMSAKVQPADVEHYLRQGAVDVIEKPFEPMMLADNLRSIWRRLHRGCR